MTSASSVRRRWVPSAWHLVLLPVALLMAAPLLWMVLTSLSTLEETRRFPPGLPSSPHWSNYATAWNDSPLGHWLLNSAIAAYYYLRVMVYMYMREPVPGAPVAVPMKSSMVNVALIIAAVAVALLGIFPTKALQLAATALP